MHRCDDPTRRTIIFESDRLRVVEQDAGSQTVFVSFNELGLLKTQDFFWGHEFFAKEGISAFGIVTTEPNWYPPDEMAQAVAAIRQLIGERRVVTYGHSQGGYGAIKYSSALRAVAAVAFCPQWSLAPDAVGSFDQRYTGFYRPDWRNGLPIEQTDVSGRAFVLFDPREAIDARHVDRIEAVADVARVPVPLSGHETVRLVTESGLSSEFIRLFCREMLPSAAECRHVMRRARRLSKTYGNNLLSGLAGRPEGRRALFCRAVSDLPSQGTPFARTIRSLQEGDNAQAEACLRGCSDEDLLRFGAVRLWRLFRDASFQAGELRLAEILLQRFPENAFLRLHAVNSLLQGGLFERARGELLGLLGETDWAQHQGHVRDFARAINAEFARRGDGLGTIAIVRTPVRDGGAADCLQATRS